MTAMDVDRFVVTLRNAKERKQEERHWHKDEVMYGMAWLKRMNAHGYLQQIQVETSRRNAQRDKLRGRSR
jgi:ribosomal protein S8